MGALSLKRGGSTSRIVPPPPWGFEGAPLPATLSRPRRAARLRPPALPPRPLGIPRAAAARGAPARRERPGDDRAEAAHGEPPVDGQARELAQPARRNRLGEAPERSAKLQQPLTRLRRDGKERRALEERAAHERRDLVLHELEPVALDEIGLGQHDEAALDVQERADREVLARLGHHALVGGDDEHREVDAADAGEHVLHEALMPGDVDDLDDEARGLLEEGEPEVDRDPARLLLGQTVGVDAGERLHQRGLAVIDVARRADDDVLGHWSGGRAPGERRGWRAVGTTWLRRSGGRAPGARRGWRAVGTTWLRRSGGRAPGARRGWRAVGTTWLRRSGGGAARVVVRTRRASDARGEPE